MTNDDDVSESDMVRKVLDELNDMFGGSAGEFAMTQLGPGMYAATFTGDVTEDEIAKITTILNQMHGVRDSFHIPENRNFANIFAVSPTESIN